MAENGGRVNQRDEAALPGSAALRVASRGVRTLRDLGNLSLGVTLDTLTGHAGARLSHAALRGIGETRKIVETGSKIGENRRVLDGDQMLDVATVETEQEALRKREAELTAELEAIRERRSA